MSPITELIGGAKAYGWGSLVAVEPAFESIATSAVTNSTTTTITFSSIPSTYTHLHLRCISRTDRGNAQEYLIMRFNGDSGNNYYYHQLFANISSVLSGWSSGSQSRFETPVLAGDSAAANNFGTCLFDIFDYTNTNKKKVVRMFGGTSNSSTAMYVGLFSGTWNSTSTLTSISFSPGNGGTYFKQGSHFALYGIKGAA